MIGELEPAVARAIVHSVWQGAVVFAGYLGWVHGWARARPALRAAVARSACWVRAGSSRSRSTSPARDASAGLPVRPPDGEL